MLPAAPKSGKQDQVLGQLEGALLQTLHGGLRSRAPFASAF